MSTIPYPFQHDRGPYYHVALGDGEYIRVVLAGDYEIERNCLNRWMEIALRQHQQNCGHTHVEDCRVELDELYLAIESRRPWRLKVPKNPDNKLAVTYVNDLREALLIFREALQAMLADEIIPVEVRNQYGNLINMSFQQAGLYEKGRLYHGE